MTLRMCNFVSKKRPMTYGNRMTKRTNTEGCQVPSESTTSTLDVLLARFDPEKHKHELLMDDEPMGQETI